MKNIFLIAGRTGGPYFPLPVIADNFPDFKSIYIGVRGGFEDKVCKQKKLSIKYLPDARLSILTFKKEKIIDTVLNYLGLLKNILLLKWSFLKSLYLLLKFKPKLIYSTGSFLSVPMIFAARVTNFWRLTDVKIAIHQQDPLPGLSNKLTAKYANLLSCVFEYTKVNFSLFNRALVVPNPINTKLYEVKNDLNKIKNSQLKNILINKNKPKMLIFGGGSGSEDINLWTVKNIHSLLKQFQVIHLTGLLQKKKLEYIIDSEYIHMEVLFEEMVPVMKSVDVVLCRAGMASITELLYLQKPAFLVPLPHTHQEENANQVSTWFKILHQKYKDQWMEVISTEYPKMFTNIKYPSTEFIKIEQEKYFQKIRNLLDKSE